MNFIGCSVVCKKIFSSEFPDIPDKAGRKTRRRTQAIAKRYSFHVNAMNHCFSFVFLILAACEEYYCNEDDLCEIYTLQDKKLVTDIKFTVIKNRPLLAKFHDAIFIEV